MDYDAKRGDGVSTEAIADDSFFVLMQLRDQTSILLVQVLLRARDGMMESMEEVGASLHINTQHLRLAPPVVLADLDCVSRS